MNSAAKRPLPHIPELDGLRGIAALMVLCHHLFFTSIPSPERWPAPVALLSVLSHAGGNGVDLFFVLSGFLITSLLVLDRPRPNRPSPYFYWNFYWKRVLRILPLYLVALALLLVFTPGAWPYALLSLLFLANFSQLFHIVSAGPFWTLAIEEQFYLLWPRCVRSLTLRGLERLSLAIILACPVLRLADVAIHHYNFLFTFFHCDGLALGSLLACQQLRPRTAGERKTSVPPVLLLALVLTAAPFAFPFETAAWHCAVALQLSGISLLCYGIVALMVRHTGSPVLAVFRCRALTFFGLISYCLYLANDYVVRIYDHLRGPLPTGDMAQYALRAAAVFAATLLICILSRYLIELPAQSLRRHVLRRDLPDSTAAPPPHR